MSKMNGYTPDVAASLAFFDSDLFKRVQMSGIFSDSKTFADAIAKQPIAAILNQYQLVASTIDTAGLANFIAEHFVMPNTDEIIVDKPSADINKQISALWQALEMPADEQIASSLLPLKNAYVVPGGRFREIYYWDSYFSALGLIESDRLDLVDAMLANFVDLQNRFNCIPNGNRSYYLSRSQPPILGLLVELLLPYQSEKQLFIQKYIHAIETEYLFWMQGSDNLTETDNEHRRVVKMPDGNFLNRYWDDSTTPRPESYREDIELLHSTELENSTDFYRNIRAACESGWDFSSRWLGDAQSLATIRTTRILPIDLNCLLYKQEVLLGRYYALLGNDGKSSAYSCYAKTRKSTINKYMWSAKRGFFMDYDVDLHASTDVLSLAGVLPLFTELANQEQAEKVALMIEKDFLQLGGLVTTCNKTSQQWDAPNGWAPLHWFAVQGLQHYQHYSLAQTISQRWLNTVSEYFNRTGKLMEKYNVCQQNHKAGGGEYHVQEGFGWTNGVYQAFTASSK